MEKLTYENALEVFQNNEALRNRVYCDALENESYYQADEILSYFRHYNQATQKAYNTLADYEIDINRRSYVKANNRYYKEFLEDCKTVANTFGIMDTIHNVENRINRVIEKIDLYEDATVGYYDMSPENYDRLEKWIDNTIEELCEYIAEYALEAYTQFDDLGVLEDYYLSIWIDYNDNFEVDENFKVYETITRCIA